MNLNSGFWISDTGKIFTVKVDKFIQMCYYNNK